MHLYEFNAHDAHIPGTIIGLYKAHRFKSEADARAITDKWDDEFTGWSIESIEYNDEVLFYAVLIYDEDDGKVIGIL